MIVCYDKIWTTLDPKDTELTEMELLDACDVHLIFLHPGIFAKLVLKKKHTAITQSASKGSPPENPQWTMGNQEQTTDITRKLTDSALLKLYLNIQDNNTTDVLQHEKPLPPSPSKASTVLSSTDAQTGTTSSIIDTSNDNHLC